MSFRTLALIGAVAAGGTWACGSEELNPAPTRQRDAGVDPNAPGANTTGVGAGTGADTGLPCDVQQLLENRCAGCHLAGSTTPLLSYEDMVKTASDGKSYAVKSLERMQDAARPMPPAPADPPTADEMATLKAWIDGGTPRAAACTGASGAAPTSGAYNTPTVCTSNQTWTSTDESSLMDPGQACITCHLRKGPKFTIAGTVYPSAHEPDNCYGSSSATIKVVVTDAQNKVTTLSVNETGNFRSSVAVAAPFRVKVVDGAKERPMAGTLTAGDCNSCHTEKGANGAPGRIMAP